MKVNLNFQLEHWNSYPQKSEPQFLALVLLSTKFQFPIPMTLVLNIIIISIFKNRYGQTDPWPYLGGLFSFFDRFGHP